MIRRCRELGHTPLDASNFFYGRYILMEHKNGYKTRYAHLADVDSQVMVGRHLEAGTRLGTIGNSGTSSGVRGTQNYPNLHFEILRDGTYFGYGWSLPETILL